MSINPYVTDTTASTYCTTGSTFFSVDYGTTSPISMNVTPSENVPLCVNVVKGLHPALYFRYLKSKFKFLERMAIERRMKELEKAFDKVVSAGQEALGAKLMNEIVIETKQSAIYAKGVTKFIEREVAFKYKKSISGGGHISDTLLKDYTRVIPDNVLKRKKELDGVFDGFVIFHYWNDKHEDVKKMDPQEKAKMRDPILFGVIAESNRLYFIADWKDEFCDLTFKEMVRVLGKDSQGKLTKKIELKI